MTLFLGIMNSPYLIPVIAVSLSLMIPIVAIIVDHLQKKERMRLLEKAIEHGIDVEELKLEEPPRPAVPYRNGIVSLGVGFGLLSVGVVGTLWPDVLYLGDLGHLITLMAIAGVIVLFVGVALLVNDYMNRDRVES